jgi:hypothetical protein
MNSYAKPELKPNGHRHYVTSPGLAPNNHKHHCAWRTIPVRWGKEETSRRRREGQVGATQQEKEGQAESRLTQDTTTADHTAT